MVCGMHGTRRGRALIRLLGPTELIFEGMPVPLPTAGSAGAITVLAVEAGVTVSHDRLCDMLWNTPPSSAISNLRGHIAEVRRYLRLASHGGPFVQKIQVVTVRAARGGGGGGGGYHLTAQTNDVDLHRFMRHAELGRKAMLHGDWSGALGLLREGLRLWRGAPGMGITASDRFREQLDGYTLRCLDLREDFVECLIQLGDLQQAGHHSWKMTTDHPLRERSWGQLIRIRYLLGDLDTALSSYDRARRTLMEELGCDPSPDLKRIHAAVLHREDALVLD
jgi:DNA-binding SARP family transcriptional activator